MITIVPPKKYAPYFCVLMEFDHNVYRAAILTWQKFSSFESCVKLSAVKAWCFMGIIIMSQKIIFPFLFQHFWLEQAFVFEFRYLNIFQCGQKVQGRYRHITYLKSPHIATIFHVQNRHFFGGNRHFYFKSPHFLEKIATSF